MSKHRLIDTNDFRNSKYMQVVNKQVGCKDFKKFCDEKKEYKGQFDFEHPFFTKPYSELPDEIYRKYSLETWAKVLLNITEVESYENIGDRSERVSR